MLFGPKPVDRDGYVAAAERELVWASQRYGDAAALRELRVPTLVIHGLDDTLIDPDGGRRTADLVPGAGLLLLPGMGHDRPRELCPTLVDALVAHTG